MSRHQGGTDFLFKIGYRAQRDGRTKHSLLSFFDTPFSQTMAAREVRQRGCQSGSDTMGANVGRNGCMGDFAAVQTGAAMSLIFGNFHRDGRKLDTLKALRFGIFRPGFLR